MKIKDLFTPSAVEGLKTKQLTKTCVCCGKKIKILVYKNKTYRGGHYFGKIPLYKKEDLAMAVKNTKKVKIAGKILNILKKDPHPYDYAEYWECPKCYSGK